MIYFFLLNLIIIVIKKIAQSMWVGLGWVRLDLCDRLDCVEFFFDPPWCDGLKNPLNLTHAHP